MQLLTAFFEHPLCARPCARSFNCLLKYGNIAIIPILKKRLHKLVKVTAIYLKEGGDSSTGFADSKAQSQQINTLYGLQCFVQ